MSWLDDFTHYTDAEAAGRSYMIALLLSFLGGESRDA
jgi:hypothetical protein